VDGGVFFRASKDSLAVFLLTMILLFSVHINDCILIDSEWCADRDVENENKRAKSNKREKKEKRVKE